MCYLSKTFNYFSFCANVFSSWGCSGRICYLPYCLIPKRKKRKRKKERKKGTPPKNVNVGGHPMESVSHGLWKEKKVGRSAKLYKRAQKCQSLSLKNLLHFCMEDSKNPIASRWQKQPPLKTQVLSLFYKWKALAHAQSMLPSAKGLSFTFMLSHHLLSLCTIKRA